jgi:NAD(P)-dependent dehydrogenase (short-subunit alcohol dehydrogenase family)
LAVVLDAVSPNRPVHLLAHDWGSIQTWHAVTENRLDGRVRSYTTMSGPCLDHAAHWMRSQVRPPTPRRVRNLVRQLVFSGYIGFFQLPQVPELAWRTGVMRRAIRRLDKGWVTPALSDAINGLALYRENMMPRFARPDARRTEIPVQVLAPTGDGFVTAPLQTDIGRWVSDLRVRRLPGGHWIPRERPEVIARCAGELIDYVEGAPEARGLRRARSQATGGGFEGQLAVITGAGSGIGRATAHAFAKAGAHVVVCDVDEDAARRTAERAALLGPGAAAHRVDVSDSEAVERFAKQVVAEHGAPDVVINNAGIGISGSFLDTSPQDWERAIDVNLWGVINGCRAFAGEMAARGEGGRIVNVASAAAYVPSKVLSAYATTKAAVLTFSECLRAELAASGIGVVAVCPGLVHTNITNTTRFVGVEDGEQQRRRAAATALYQRRNFTPERAAHEIVRAVQRNTAVAPITAEARVGLALSRLTPGVVRAAARHDVTSG